MSNACLKWSQFAGGDIRLDELLAEGRLLQLDFYECLNIFSLLLALSFVLPYTNILEDVLCCLQ